MDTEIQSDAGAETAMERELCDKCGSGMDLQGSAYGFQRWRCPNCQQVVGIDRDPEVWSCPAFVDTLAMRRVLVMAAGARSRRV